MEEQLKTVAKLTAQFKMVGIVPGDPLQLQTLAMKYVETISSLEYNTSAMMVAQMMEMDAMLTVWQSPDLHALQPSQQFVDFSRMKEECLLHPIKDLALALNFVETRLETSEIILATMVIKSTEMDAQAHAPWKLVTNVQEALPQECLILVLKSVEIATI